MNSRALECARYLVDNHATVRATGDALNVSKSVVHKDVTIRLERLNYPLYLDVRSVLDTNKVERALRGGLATRERYRAMKGTAV